MEGESLAVSSSTTQSSKPSFSADSNYRSKLIINSFEFTKVVEKLRSFFLKKNFVEAHPQNRLSILAACEDPFNVATFDYVGTCWPLPQTGQMWLEYELLNDDSVPGYFCLSTSYRQEKNPVDGRHDLIFPLFEFEMKGDLEEMVNLEKELLVYLGYDETKFQRGEYDLVAKKYGVKELENEHETKLYEEHSPTFFLTDFPEHTDPFWNMKRNLKNNTAKKVDVIMSGQETIGSAERETDPEIMLNRFKTICGGSYCAKMYELFGEERTMKEMKDYLSFNFFPRSGGGIGMTRLMRSMKLEGLI